MEKVSVKSQLCLRRLSMNGNQTKLAYETFRCSCRSLDQILCVQVMSVRSVHHLVKRKWIVPFIKKCNSSWIMEETTRWAISRKVARVYNKPNRRIGKHLRPPWDLENSPNRSLPLIFFWKRKQCFDPWVWFVSLTRCELDRVTIETRHSNSFTHEPLWVVTHTAWSAARWLFSIVIGRNCSRESLQTADKPPLISVIYTIIICVSHQFRSPFKKANHVEGFVVTWQKRN